MELHCAITQTEYQFRFTKVIGQHGMPFTWVLEHSTEHARNYSLLGLVIILMLYDTAKIMCNQEILTEPP